MIPTNKEPTLPNSPSNFARSTGQHHEVSATRTPGQKQIHRTGWRRKSPCVASFRTSGRKLGELLAAGGRICGASSVSRIEARCNRTSTGLREGIKGSVDGRSAVSCQVRHQGVDEIPQPCHIDHFVSHYQEVVIVEVGAALCGFYMAGSRTKHSTTRPCCWPHVFWTSEVGLLGEDSVT